MDTDTVAVVTGASQGIGRRTAEVLGAAAHRLVLCDLQPVDATADAIRAAGGREPLAVIGDLAAQATIDRIEAVVGGLGRVDVLVNNAGVSCIRPAEETSASDLRRVLEINLVAPFLLCHALGRIMLARRAGSIVNVASIAGLFGVADRSAYNASKHGLIGLTRTLAAEWGGRGVRVNAVCPGWVKTEMDAADQAGGGYTDADIVARVPMARFAGPDDIAQAILFLADPAKSGFVNGHALVVDGGWTADATWESLRLKHR